jgi:site-specific recombinase XerD
MNSSPRLAPALEAFFSQRLLQERGASANTVAAYRDSFRLLLAFVQRHRHRAPSDIALAELDAPLVAAFLGHLERDRHNSALTRNVRLAALHSFFRFLAPREPALAGSIQRVLAIPSKRCPRRPVDFLDRDEMTALLAAPDRGMWVGRRDHLMILLALQTGLRVSELIGLRRSDVVLGSGAHVRCRGKGRKERCTPMRRDVATLVAAWLKELPAGAEQPLLPTVRGAPMSRDAVEHLLARHAATASAHCRSLARKRISPHVLRHSTAMELLRSGVDRSVIALWLGHESVDTTQIYLDADLATKERALARTSHRATSSRRFHAEDQLLAFLKGL